MNGSFGFEKTQKKGLSFADCDLKGYEHGWQFSAKSSFVPRLG